MLDLDRPASRPIVEKLQILHGDEQHTDRLVLGQFLGLATRSHDIEIMLERRVGGTIAHETGQSFQEEGTLRAFHRNEGVFRRHAHGPIEENVGEVGVGNNAPQFFLPQGSHAQGRGALPSGAPVADSVSMR